MSRIGRKPLVLPKGVSLSQKPGTVGLKGPKGELVRALPEGISLKIEGDKVMVNRADDSRENRSKHGLRACSPRQHAEGRDRRLEPRARDQRRRLPRRGGR